jgi:hypothetical protein
MMHVNGKERIELIRMGDSDIRGPGRDSRYPELGKMITVVD